MKLTLRSIESIKPGKKDIYVWDDNLKGLGMRVKPSGVKTFFIQYRNANGESKRLTIGKFGHLTPDEARTFAKKKLLEVVEGKDPVEERTKKRNAVTVAELCEDYMKAASKGMIYGKGNRPKKQSTIYVDRGRIEHHILPLLGKRKVNDLSTPDIMRFMREVASGKTATDVKTRKRGRAIVKGGSGTASRTIGLLGGILSYAVTEGIIQLNPVRGVKRPADKSRDLRLNAAEFNAIGKALKIAVNNRENIHAIKIVYLLMLTGCRLNEIARLRWSEVDFAGQCLRLEDSKEGKSIRPLGKIPHEMLLQWKQEKAAMDSKSTLVEISNPYIFPGQLPGKSYRGVQDAWQRIKKNSRIEHLPEDFILHGFRHAFGSVAADLGYADSTIAAMLGQSMGTVTSRYIHHLDEFLLAATNRVSSHIAAMMDGSTQGAEVIAMDRAKAGA